MFNPSRGGVRGGHDQFKWEDVKEDKHRENYLGHSLKAPVGRWQKGRDLQWYANESKDPKTKKEIRAAEIKAIKEAEEDALAEVLGYPVKKRLSGSNNIEVAELNSVLKKKNSKANNELEDEVEQADKIEGSRSNDKDTKFLTDALVQDKNDRSIKSDLEYDESKSNLTKDSPQCSDSSRRKAKKSKKSKKHKKHKKSRKYDDSDDDEHTSSRRNKDRVSDYKRDEISPDTSYRYDRTSEKYSSYRSRSPIRSNYRERRDRSRTPTRSSRSERRDSRDEGRTRDYKNRYSRKDDFDSKQPSGNDSARYRDRSRSYSPYNRSRR